MSIRDYDYSPNYQHKPIGNIRDYKGYKMYLLKPGEKIPIPFGTVEWEDSINTLGMQLSFSAPRNPLDRYMKNYDRMIIGDKIMFVNNDNVIFSGIVTNMDITNTSRDVTALDYAHLLNKNKILRQFVKVDSTKAIKDLCGDMNIPVGKIEGLSVSITEIYQNKSASEIIDDIIQKNSDATGIDYRLELRDGKLVIEPYSNLMITPITKPAANVSMFDATLLPMDITKSHSIDDMVNKVVITTKNDKNTEIIHTSENNEMVARFGTFQEVVDVGKDEVKDARKIAEQYLKNKSAVNTRLSVTLFGDDKVRAGRVITLFNETFGLDGMFLIENCKQKYENNVRTMALDLKEVK